MESSPNQSSNSLPEVHISSRTRPQSFEPVNTDSEDDINVQVTSNKKFGQAVSSSDEENNSVNPNHEDASFLKPNEEDNHNLQPENRNRSTLSSDTPYKQSPLPPEAYDVNFGQYEDLMTDSEKKVLRKRNKKMICVGMSSTASPTEVEWAMKYYDMEGTWACPPNHMRPHRFDYGPDFKIPRSVLTLKHLALGVGAPLHPYYRDIVEWYDVAPIQLSPNSYKLAAALFILYHDKNFGAPTMEELNYFFSLRKSDMGYYFLVVHKKHNNLGFSEGRISHLKQWKESFFYVWDVERVKITFNLNPSKDVSSQSLLFSINFYF